MPQKEQTKKTNVRDMKPKKDAKGGVTLDFQQGYKGASSKPTPWSGPGTGVGRGEVGRGG